MTERLTSEIVQSFLKKHGEKYVTWKLFMANIDGLTEQIVSLVHKPLHDRITELEKQTADLNATKSATLADSYRGQWLQGAIAKRGDLCTHDGSLFLCLADTKEKPGTGSEWRMVTKRGRDGRDARQ